MVGSSGIAIFFWNTTTLDTQRYLIKYRRGIFVLFLHKYLFNISTIATLEPRILHNSFFAKHFSLTAFDLYNSHLDDSGLEYTFLLRNIFCANEEANFPASPLFFSEFNKDKSGLILWLETTFRPLTLLAVQKLISLGNM